jgi:putative aminopeptidase FrvX
VSAIPPLLDALLRAPGPSGDEAAPARAWRESASAFAEVSSDTVGTSYARVAGRGERPRVAVVGHIDEIGLIVTHVDDRGFLHFRGVGGWDWQVLVGQRVTIATRDGPVPGVVGRKPIHLLKDEERKQVVEAKTLHIDVGAKDADEARSLVRIGDTAVIDVEPLELPNGRLASRSLDNRLGAYVAHEAARLVAEAGGAAGELVAVATAQEETTFGGARTSAFALDPDVAIVVDVTFASDVPGVEASEVGSQKLGSGPVLTRGTIVHPAVFELLHEAAEAEGIPFEVEAGSGRSGTDADAIHLSRAGIPCAVVSIPLRYMHSPVELVQLDDVEACARLVAAFARRLEAGASFGR